LIRHHSADQAHGGPGRDILIAILAGAGVALLSSWLLGYTAAIPAPHQWFVWFNNSLGSYAGLVAWELLAVQFPAAGLTAALAAFVLVRCSSLPWWQTCLLLIGAELATTVFLQFPHFHSLRGLLLLQHAHELVVILCILTAGYLSSRSRKKTHPV